VTSLGNAAAPLCYFPSKHANKITVQLDRIDDIEREDHHPDRSQVDDHQIKPERHVTPGRGMRLRQKLKKGKGESKVHHNQNPDPDEARPELVATKIGVPRLLSGKFRLRSELVRTRRTPKIESYSNIPPAKTRRRQGIETKAFLEFSFVGA